MTWMMILVANLMVAGAPGPLDVAFKVTHPNEASCREALKTSQFILQGVETQYEIKAECFPDPATYSAEKESTNPIPEG